MTNISKTLEVAKEKYQQALSRLSTVSNDPTKFQLAAQEANDAWIEFKKLSVEFSNHLIRKKMGELYDF